MTGKPYSTSRDRSVNSAYSGVADAANIEWRIRDLLGWSAVLQELASGTDRLDPCGIGLIGDAINDTAARLAADFASYQQDGAQ